MNDLEYRLEGEDGEAQADPGTSAEGESKPEGEGEAKPEGETAPE